MEKVNCKDCAPDGGMCATKGVDRVPLTSACFRPKGAVAEQVNCKDCAHESCLAYGKDQPSPIAPCAFKSKELPEWNREEYPLSCADCIFETCGGTGDDSPAYMVSDLCETEDKYAFKYGRTSFSSVICVDYDSEWTREQEEYSKGLQKFFSENKDKQWFKDAQKEYGEEVMGVKRQAASKPEVQWGEKFTVKQQQLYVSPESALEAMKNPHRLVPAHSHVFDIDNIPMVGNHDVHDKIFKVERIESCSQEVVDCKIDDSGDYWRHFDEYRWYAHRLLEDVMPEQESYSEDKIQTLKALDPGKTHDAVTWREWQDDTIGDDIIL